MPSLIEILFGLISIGMAVYILIMIARLVMFALFGHWW